MKKNKVVTFAAIGAALALIVMMAGCASSPAGNEAPVERAPVAHGPDESVVIIQRKKSFAGSAVSMKVWIDDKETASSIQSGQEAVLVIADGEHTIQAGSSTVDRGNKITVTLAGEEVIYTAEPQMGMFSAQFKLTQTSRQKL